MGVLEGGGWWDFRARTFYNPAQPEARLPDGQRPCACAPWWALFAAASCGIKGLINRRLACHIVWRMQRAGTRCGSGA